MIPSIEEIKNNYRLLPDSKLLELASYSANGLRPEALDALKEELKARKLDTNLDQAIDVQMNNIDSADLSMLVAKIQKLPCPYCGSKTKKLNAISVATVKSFVLLTSHSKKVVIACEDCQAKINHKALLTTALMGWWGIPFGIIRTPIALYVDITNKQKAKSVEATDVLNNFVLAHRGAITKAGNNEEELLNLVRDI